MVAGPKWGRIADDPSDEMDSGIDVRQVVRKRVGRLKEGEGHVKAERNMEARTMMTPNGCLFDMTFS